ncbi:MAG: GNAT family N-acetyltransferase [Jaaginema sp. PMC 1079.18]|nr:GNAT family N-acetyltransferase [Jaaginema sp. PMC 1080.18]MEC4851678.1 GNAT family N-acetyltransferase [Jaaginema sp. PMC 1079.18]MEC4868100.1 GNAT family N-acetyltransferase [Jaaginema sp. PMC 1078.18]
MSVTEKTAVNRLIPAIKKAAIAEQNYIMASLTLAFHNDPANRWLYADAYRYLTYFPQFVQAFSGKAFTHNTVYCTEDYTGAALWYPPGIEPDVEAIIQLMQTSISEADQEDVFAVFEQMEGYHPQDRCWYLTFLGVEPMQQRRGYGMALMSPVLEQCDRDRVPAYLESSNPANIPFYQRHGFEVIGTIQAGSSPEIFPMLRHPR